MQKLSSAFPEFPFRKKFLNVLGDLPVFTGRFWIGEPGFHEWQPIGRDVHASHFLLQSLFLLPIAFVMLQTYRIYTWFYTKQDLRRRERAIGIFIPGA